MTVTDERRATRVADDTSTVSLSPPRKRKVSWIALGVLLVVIAMLIGAYTFVAVTDTSRVLVADSELLPGQQVTAADFRVVEVGVSSQLDVISANDQDRFLGMSPRSIIPAGSVVSPAMLVPVGELVPDGSVVVGASLPAGAVPTAMVKVGDQVQLYGPIATDSAESGLALIGEGEIFAMRGAADAGSAASRVWLSFTVNEDLATAVANAAAAEELRLGLLGE